MRIKDRSVKVGKFVPALVWALGAIKDLYRRYKVEMVITSGCEGKDGDGLHMDGSKHYTGEGVDLRSNKFSNYDKECFAKDVRENIGPEFDFIVESDHFHLEYDVKKGGE